MNSPVLMLAVGLAAGILLGRSMKQCATASHATGNDVWSGLVNLGTAAVKGYYHEDDEDKR